VQTIGILGNLRLQWPPPVERFTEVASLSFVDSALVRAECLAADGANAFVALQQAQAGTLLGGLLIVGMCTKVHLGQRHGRHSGVICRSCARCCRSDGV
jgi:hypothetical protein